MGYCRCCTHLVQEYLLTWILREEHNGLLNTAPATSGTFVNSLPPPQICQRKMTMAKWHFGSMYACRSSRCIGNAKLHLQHRSLASLQYKALLSHCNILAELLLLKPADSAGRPFTDHKLMACQADTRLQSGLQQANKPAQSGTSWSSVRLLSSRCCPRSSSNDAARAPAHHFC